MKMNTKRNNKGYTLVEITLYLALFSVVFGIVINFAMSVNESNRKAEEMNNIQSSLIFLTQHMNETFKVSDEIDEGNSECKNDDGRLRIRERAGPGHAEEYVEYSLSNGRVIFTNNEGSFYLTDSLIVVEQFYLEEVKEEDILKGIRLTLKMYSVKDPQITNTNQTMFILR